MCPALVPSPDAREAPAPHFSHPPLNRLSVLTPNGIYLQVSALGLPHINAWRLLLSSYLSLLKARTLRWTQAEAQRSLSVGREGSPENPEGNVGLALVPARPLFKYRTSFCQVSGQKSLPPGFLAGNRLAQTPGTNVLPALTHYMLHASHLYFFSNACWVFPSEMYSRKSTI